MKTIFLSLFLCALVFFSNGQTIPYGNNPKAGKYINVGDARLYYEVYGSGSPLLLLHGDTFGWIDEFDQSMIVKKYCPGLSNQERL